MYEEVTFSPKLTVVGWVPAALYRRLLWLFSYFGCGKVSVQMQTVWLMEYTTCCGNQQSPLEKLGHQNHLIMLLFHYWLQT